MDDELIVCSKCNGKRTLEEPTPNSNYCILLACPKCGGDGKLDWVENVVGKEISGLNFISYVRPIKAIEYIKVDLKIGPKR